MKEQETTYYKVDENHVFVKSKENITEIMNLDRGFRIVIPGIHINLTAEKIEKYTILA